MYKNQKTVLKPYVNLGENVSDRLVGPTVDAETRRPLTIHRALDFDGIVHAGARVYNRDVLVNKQSPVIDNSSTGGSGGADGGVAGAAAGGGEGPVASSAYGMPAVARTGSLSAFALVYAR